MNPLGLQLNRPRKRPASPKLLDDRAGRLHAMFEIYQSSPRLYVETQRGGDILPADPMRLYHQEGRMGATTKAPPKAKKINRNWFLARIKERGTSMRKLSQSMQLDASAVSLILSDQRGMTPAEVKRMADLLLVPSTEIMRNLGIDIRDDVRRVPIAGHISASSEVTLHARGTEESVIGPADMPNDAVALQWRTVGSALYYTDGWLAFVSMSHARPEDHIGKMVICADQSSGKIYKGMLMRGYKSGLYNISFVPGQNMMENVTVAWCAPILWIKPG